MVTNSIEAVVERTVLGLGYALADFELSNRGKLLRVFIERPGLMDGAVTIDDCTKVTRQLQKTLPVEGVEFDRLEISSPGLDRKLKKIEDFARFQGREAAIRLRVPVNGRRNVIGTLQGVREQSVHLTVDDQMIEFELANLERARLVPQLPIVGGRK